MTSKDELEFEAQVGAIDGTRIARGQSYDLIHFDDVTIQYERSQLVGSTLTAGRIAIATTGLGGEKFYPQPSGAESVYKKLRTWLRKNYSNSLVCFSDGLPPESRLVVPTKNFWLGRHASHWLRENGGCLRQFKTAGAFFEPAP